YKSLRIGKSGAISFLIDKKALLTILILIAVAIILFLVSTGLGEMKIDPITVVKTLFGYGTRMEQLVVTSFRLPRIIIAFLVGMALAAAGSILQGMIRNPLASPDILGITGGASVAVVAFLAVFSNSSNALTVSVKWMPVAAFLGATVIAFL